MLFNIIRDPDNENTIVTPDGFGSNERKTAEVINFVLRIGVFIVIFMQFTEDKVFLWFSEFAFISALSYLIDLAVKRKCHLDEKLRCIVMAVLFLAFSAVMFTRRDFRLTKYDDGGFFKIFGCFFALSFILHVICTAAGESLKKRRCTVPVMAACVGTASDSGFMSNKRAVQVWQFCFEGENIKTVDKIPCADPRTFTQGGGAVAEIMVNPDDPYDIYRKVPFTQLLRS